ADTCMVNMRERDVRLRVYHRATAKVEVNVDAGGTRCVGQCLERRTQSPSLLTDPTLVRCGPLCWRQLRKAFYLWIDGLEPRQVVHRCAKPVDGVERRIERFHGCAIPVQGPHGGPISILHLLANEMGDAPEGGSTHQCHGCAA